MSSKILSCYYSFGTSALHPEGINGDLMTHLLVGWAGIDPTTGKMTVSPENLEGFKRCIQLKAKYPHLKVCVVCGEYSSGDFSTMANHPTLVASFVKSALDLLQTYGFDGLDLDWEFPVWG